jgi:hypothetical protein
MTACGVRWCRCGSTARLRKPRRSSELTQSLSQRPSLACLMPQPPARGGRFGGVAAVFVVAVVYSLRSTRSQRATVHPAAPPATAGDRHGFPDLVLAPHRAALLGCSGSGVGCTGSCVIFRLLPPLLSTNGLCSRATSCAQLVVVLNFASFKLLRGKHAHGDFARTAARN